MSYAADAAAGLIGGDAATQTVADAAVRTDTFIPTADGGRVAVSLFVPRAPPRRAVALYAATAVPRRFYRRFAAWLAGRGAAVLTLDYRCVGDSADPALLRRDIRFATWGFYDAGAAFARLRATYPDLPVTLMGHSIGGVAAGLQPRHDGVDRVVTIGAQTCYHKDFNMPLRLTQAERWRFELPFWAAVLGYYPGTRLGLGTDLPGAFARDWAYVCTAPDFRVDASGRPRTRPDGRTLTDALAAVTAPVIAYSFTDDALATERAVNRLLGYFTGAPREHRVRRPADYGVRSIGHFGFARPAFESTLWPELAAAAGL